MNYAFDGEARQEFLDAIDYYESREEGLGYDFAHEVYSTVERVAAHPKLWPFMCDEIRRCLIRRFPYAILYYYDEDHDEILVLAVMHLHRDPEYWKHRI